MRPLAVAWDAGGTLIDSEPIHLRALLRVAAEHGADLSGWTDDAFVGVALPDVWTAVAPRFRGIDGAAFARLVNAAYVAEIAGAVHAPGAREALGGIAACGVAQAAVSNSHCAVAEANRDALGVRALLRCVVALEDVSRPKPDPAPYLCAAGRLGIATRRMIAVEDSAPGAASALAAGCDTIAVAPVAETGARLTVVRALAEAADVIRARIACGAA